MADVHQPNIQQHHHVSGWAGWVVFAGLMLAISGVLHIIYGIGGVVGQDWYLYASGNAYVFDSSAWGWTMIAGGALLLMTSALLFAGNMLGRVLGVILAAASLLANLAMISIAPVWSVIAIIVDLAIIYAIIAHGSELKHLEE